jgi:hypothetical protein
LPSCPGGGKRSFGPGRDHAGFELSHGDHLLQQELASRAFNLGEVGKSDIHVCVKQTAKEGDTAGEPVYLAYNERTPVQTCGGQGLVQFRPTPMGAGAASTTTSF